METLTFHSLRGGQTTGARAEEKIEYTLKVEDRRRIPPLRRLCPCFSLWCCLPCVCLLLLPIGIIVWDSTRDPKRIDRPPPSLPPSPRNPSPSGIRQLAHW